MAKVKTKVKVVHPETLKDKERKALKTEAILIVKTLQDCGYSQNYISEKMAINYATLSRFMSLSDGYITKSMVDSAKEFIKIYVVDKNDIK